MRSVAVVTGAASGMGRACVDAVAPLVDTVAVVDLAAPTIEGVESVACDVSDPEQVFSLAEQIDSIGRFRALIHAAGVSPTMADASRVLAVDLVGTELMLRAFERLVTPGSAAVCFASTAAHMVGPFLDEQAQELLADPLAPSWLERATSLIDNSSGLAYALAKAGVVRAAGRHSVRWGKLGGRVNSLSPGLIDTPMGRQEFEQQPIKHEMLAQTPLRRLGTAQEIAAVAAFLVSDSASFVTGIDVLADGGQTQGALHQEATDTDS